MRSSSAENATVAPTHAEGISRAQDVVYERDDIGGGALFPVVKDSVVTDVQVLGSTVGRLLPGIEKARLHMAVWKPSNERLEDQAL